MKEKKDLLRNPEVRRQLLWEAGLTLLLTLLAGLLAGPAAAAFTLLAGLGASLTGLLFLRRRYDRIDALSREIGEILHGTRDVLSPREEEGELAILESEIRKMTVRLSSAADRLDREKKDLADAMADIAHQLRTPLTSLRLTAELLAGEDLSPEKREGLLRDLKRQLSRMSWLIETLLKMARIDVGTASFEKRTVRAASLAEKACEPMQIPAELKGVRLVIRAGEETFEADPRWTEEALGNLVKNCVEHTPAGGEVVLTASETALFTQITVEDTGEGFPPEDLPRLFERFYKGKNAGEGSVGIGLSLARSIAAAQGGTLTAENRTEGGARFVLRFYRGAV